LTANPTSVKKGGSSTLEWYATNASSCLASDGWSGDKTPVAHGTEVITNITSAKTFTLTCSTVSNTASVKVKVTVPVYQDF
jgi:hypothetical protein